MLQPCANPNCSVHFAAGLSECPVCRTPAPVTQPDGGPASRRAAGTTGDMTAEQIRGRALLTTFLTLIILSDAFTGMLSIGAGMAGSLSRAIRLCLTICLFSALYRGNIYAKLLSIVLMGLGGVWGIVLIVNVGATSGNLLAALLLLGLTALFLSFVVVLVWSRSVNAFLAYQRGERTGFKCSDPSSGTLPESTEACPMCGAPIDTNARKCNVCGEGSTGPQVSGAQPSGKLPSRRTLAICAVVVVSLLLLGVFGFARKVRTYTRITITYPHAPPEQVEAQIGLPLEYALAGLPYVIQVTGFCSNGKAEYEITWEGECNLTRLRERLQYAADQLPQGAGPPFVTKVAENRPVVLDNAVALVASVEPDKLALTRLRIREEDIWKAAMPVYLVADDVDLQVALLEQVRVKSETGGVPLTDVATVVAVERPTCIVREMGRRLEDWPIEVRPRAKLLQ